MDCPECRKGKIRVMTIVACSCGHHTLFCDACFKSFMVRCGAPYGPSALPPEVPMTVSDDFRRVHEQLQREVPDAPRKSYEDMMRETMAQMPEAFPEIEAFKADLAG